MPDVSGIRHHSWTALSRELDAARSIGKEREQALTTISGETMEVPCEGVGSKACLESSLYGAGFRGCQPREHLADLLLLAAKRCVDRLARMRISSKDLDQRPIDRRELVLRR